MSVTDQIRQIVEAEKTRMENDPEFVRLRDFYAEMQKAGIAQKQSYTLPPLDTVGRRIYQGLSMKSAK